LNTFASTTGTNDDQWPRSTWMSRESVYWRLTQKHVKRQLSDDFAILSEWVLHLNMPSSLLARRPAIRSSGRLSAANIGDGDA
jgi:hypothetical protein